MTETEKRRTQLLQQTRQLYSEKYMLPAVHPRYQNVYHSLYKGESAQGKKSSFGVRLLIAVLLFGLFVLASDNDWKETETVVETIEESILDYIPK